MGIRARVLVVGSGSREHALAAALAAGECQVVVAPGNAGTAGNAAGPGPLMRNADVRADDIHALVHLAAAERIDLVVVGPEVPLALGLVDALQQRGLAAFGPTGAAARLEASKAFM